MANFPPKICDYCGKEFIPKSNHARYCKGPHYMKCPVCNKEYEVTNNDKLKFPPTACSYACRTILRTKTSLKRYGCTAPGNNPEARKKASDTMMKNLGVPYAMMSEEVHEKSKQILLEKYGVDNVGKNKEIRERRMKKERENHGGRLAFNTPESYAHRKETVLQRYGQEVFSIPEIREKIKKTMLEKYGAEYMMQVPEFKAKQQESIFQHYGVRSAFASPEIQKKVEQTMLERYGVTNPAYSEELMKKAEQTMLERYGKCARISKLNLKFKEFLEENNIHAESEHFILGKWFDFCIPDQQILIEINPTYTHNILGNHWGAGVTRDYHIAKTNLAREHGFRCIHIWDWDNWDSILDLIQPHIKIPARKCKVFKLYTNIAESFLEKNSIYDVGYNNLVCFGIVYEDQLIQVMTFGRPKDKNYTVEISNICSKKGITVVGGVSRLFRAALQYIEPNSVIVYNDTSKFTGNIYGILGMNHVRHDPPKEIWSKGTEKISAEVLHKKGFNSLFHVNKEIESNDKAMIESYWLPIYDCGYDVYEYVKK